MQPCNHALFQATSLPPGPTGLLSGLRASTIPVRIFSPYSSHADHFKTLPPAASSPTLSLAHSIPAILTSLLSINYAKLPLLGMFFLRIRTACSLTAQPLCSAVTPERSLNIYLIQYFASLPLRCLYFSSEFLLLSDMFVFYAPPPHTRIKLRRDRNFCLPYYILCPSVC